jgi:hypothetical protein
MALKSPNASTSLGSLARPRTGGSMGSCDIGDFGARLFERLI